MFADQIKMKHAVSTAGICGYDPSNPVQLQLAGQSACECSRQVVNSCKELSGVVSRQVTQAFGANRWDTAQFSDNREKDKFIKLMASASLPPTVLPWLASVDG